MTYGPCTLCKGARLSQAALGCKINGYNIAQLAAMEVDEMIEVIRAIKDPVAAPMVSSLIERLQHMIDIGLEYLSLNRETDTLSDGESQHIKMVKHLSSSLVDVLYIFDEPSIGMHPRDVHRLHELLQKLRDKDAKGKRVREILRSVLFGLICYNEKRNAAPTPAHLLRNPMLASIHRHHQRENSLWTTSCSTHLQFITLAPSAT